MSDFEYNLMVLVQMAAMEILEEEISNGIYNYAID